MDVEQLSTSDTTVEPIEQPSSFKEMAALFQSSLPFNDGGLPLTAYLEENADMNAGTELPSDEEIYSDDATDEEFDNEIEAVLGSRNLEVTKAAAVESVTGIQKAVRPMSAARTRPQSASNARRSISPELYNSDSEISDE